MKSLKKNEADYIPSRCFSNNNLILDALMVTMELVEMRGKVKADGLRRNIKSSSKG